MKFSKFDLYALIVDGAYAPSIFSMVAARALLRISVLQLAKLSNVGEATIKRIEAGTGLPSANIKTLDSLIKAFQLAGIEFIGTPDDRPGVRLR
jgi:transcriptional regulator with XRE-family HTH domain